MLLGSWEESSAQAFCLQWGRLKGFSWHASSVPLAEGDLQGSRGWWGGCSSVWVAVTFSCLFPPPAAAPVMQSHKHSGVCSSF